MIGIYDKGGGGFVTNVLKAANNISAEGKRYHKVVELEKCDIAIAHILDDDWEELLNNSRENTVRVRVSSAGFSHPVSPIITANNVYEFHLVSPAGNVKKEEWQDILIGISDKTTLEALVRGENPRGLRRLFVHEAQEILSALAILCQGYLVVHAQYKGSDKDWNDEDIASALERMGWTDFIKTDEATRLIPSDLGNKSNLDKVRGADWWLDVFGVLGEEKNIVPEKWKDFEERLKKEWDEAKNGAVWEVIKALQKKQRVASPKTVGQAYLAIADRLEGK